MRRFDADYLRRTRRGLWADRTALDPLSLPDRERVLDVGCGTGELTRVLAEEAPADATVIGLDADRDLLTAARGAADAVLVGDATRLPVAADAVDLAACQALLVNLPDPRDAVAELARVSTDLVAAVEPDNAAVTVESTVDAEAAVERRAREAYLAGVATDVAPGDRVADLFRDAGLTGVRTRRHRHEKRVEPPYREADLRDAARKASGAGLADHEAELRRALDDEAYDALRADWRAVGRQAVAAMQEGGYRRVEVVPFDVTVGRVPASR
ncbi:MAG: methyltransferase domain-containing protein [Haloferacaceae archaeon]